MTRVYYLSPAGSLALVATFARERNAVAWMQLEAKTCPPDSYLLLVTDLGELSHLRGQEK